jgi:hypothetical protein
MSLSKEWLYHIQKEKDLFLLKIHESLFLSHHFYALSSFSLFMPFTMKHKNIIF